jgi:hypothetical protein
MATTERVTDTRDLVCPVCGSREWEGHEILTDDDGWIRQKVVCQSCLATWVDAYLINVREDISKNRALIPTDWEIHYQTRATVTLVFKRKPNTDEYVMVDSVILPFQEDPEFNYVETRDEDGNRTIEYGDDFVKEWYIPDFQDFDPDDQRSLEMHGAWVDFMTSRAIQTGPGPTDTLYALGWEG